MLAKCVDGPDQADPFSKAISITFPWGKYLVVDGTKFWRC